MPSENAIPILVMFLGCFAATGTSLLLGVGVAASYLHRKRVGWFAALVCTAAVFAASIAVLAAVRLATLEEQDQLGASDLTNLMASYERARAVYELASGSLPEPLRDQIAEQLDIQEVALKKLETALWQIRRTGPWEEAHLLYHIHSYLLDLVIAHPQLTTALRSSKCSAVVTAEKVNWPNLLMEAWRQQEQNLGVLGEGFAGVEFQGENVGYVSRTYRMFRYLAVAILACGVVLLIAAGGVLYRRRSVLPSDAIILLTGTGFLLSAFVLFGFSRLGVDALLEESFEEVRAAYHESLSLREALGAPPQREASSRTRILFSDFERNHWAYFGDLQELAGLVSAWHEAVLLDKPRIDRIELGGSITREELPDRVRAQLVQTFRKWAFLERQLRALRCQGAGESGDDLLQHYRELWKPPPGSQHPLEEMMRSR